MFPDLTSLALLARTVEGKSLSKAAEEMHIALSAASRRIGLLEHEFKVNLLHRLPGGGVEPTEAGVALARLFVLLRRDVDLMRVEMSDYVRGAKGHVRIQANTSAMSQDLPVELASFSNRFPEIKLEIREARSSDIVKAVREGRADLGVVMEGIPFESLRRLPYRPDRLCAIVGRSHPLRAKRSTFDKLLDHDFVGLDNSAALTLQMERAAQAAGKPLRLPVQVQSYEAVCRMVESGYGIGILPEGAIRPYMSTLGIRRVALTDPWALRQMYLVMGADRVTAQARGLAEFLARPARQ